MPPVLGVAADEAALLEAGALVGSGAFVGATDEDDALLDGATLDAGALLLDGATLDATELLLAAGGLVGSTVGAVHATASKAIASTRTKSTFFISPPLGLAQLKIILELDAFSICFTSLTFIGMKKHLPRKHAPQADALTFNNVHRNETVRMSRFALP